MLWYNFGQHLLSLAALLVIVSCGGAEPRRGPESSTGGSSSSNYSSRRFHRIQHGQCTYTFILPEEEGAGGAPCRESKASSPQRNGNSFQRDSPLPEQEFPSQKIQQLENIMENNTQWLQKVRRSLTFFLVFFISFFFNVKCRKNAVDFPVGHQIASGASLHENVSIPFEVFMLQHIVYCTIYMFMGVCGLCRASVCGFTGLLVLVSGPGSQTVTEPVFGLFSRLQPKNPLCWGRRVFS